MPKAVNRPTAEQAEEFDRHIQHWQRFLNLQDWRLERGQKPAINAMASIETNSGARLGVYRLGDFGATPVTTKSLSMTALHECLHVFLHDLIETAQDRAATPDQLEAVEHRVINVLEKVLFGEVNG